MELVTILIRQVSMMFIMMAIGYFLYKKQMVSNQGAKDIGKILLNLVVPIIVISNFCIERNSENTKALIDSTIVTIICMAIATIISALVFHSRNSIDEFSATFSNAGFIGIPLIQSSIGDRGVFYVSIMIVLVGLLQWTYGVYAITNDKKYINASKLISNPMTISVIIGIILYALNIKLPAMANSLMSSFSALNTPLAMVVCGVYLAQSDLLSALKNKEVYFVTLMRNVVIPLITLLILKIVNVGNLQINLAILMASACPVGLNVSVFAQQYNKDYQRGVENVCVSTIFSIISIPLVVYLATIVLS